MSKILKNTTEDDVEITDTGYTVPASGQIEIDPAQYVMFANSSDVISLVGDGTLVVNDGSTDLSISGGIDLLKGFQQKLAVDSDLATMSRFKIAPAGWRLEARFMEFTTATNGSVVNQDILGQDIGDASLKFYDSNNDEITNMALLSTECQRTDLLWQPDYGMYVVGGSAWWSGVPASAMRLCVVMADGVPAQYGGSIEVITGGANLKVLPVGVRLSVDGRSPKYLPASPSGANWFRISVRHALQDFNTIQMLWEIYRE